MRTEVWHLAPAKTLISSIMKVKQYRVALVTMLDKSVHPDDNMVSECAGTYSEKELKERFGLTDEQIEKLQK